MNKNILTIAIAALFGFTTASAQSVLGSWTKTNEVLTKADGKSVNTLEKLQKAIPCFAGIVYTFSSGGKMSEDAAGCPANVQKVAASVNQQTTWKQSGGKLILDVSDATAPMLHGQFQLRFNGPNEMVTTFIYAENPGTPNPTKAKEIVTTYHRHG